MHTEYKNCTSTISLRVKYIVHRMELTEALRVFYKEAARLWHGLEDLRKGLAVGAPALQPLLQALKALDVIVEHAATQTLASRVKALISVHTRYKLPGLAELDWLREQYAQLLSTNYCFHIWRLQSLLL